MTKEVRVRIAPSPTGDPHVGTAFMALFNYVFARHYGGKFILRIEDTDQTRSRPEYEQNIYEAIQWCGISWDEGPNCGGPFGPYRQSERLPIYQKYAQQLLDEGKAYKCYCTQEELNERRLVMASRGGRQGYDRRCRNLSDEEQKAFEAEGRACVIRLEVPLTGECTYEDRIKGRVVVPLADVDDQVLQKSDGFPTYHLANVVDDHLMEITHVIRGDEWMSSVPKHMLLYQFFGWEPPEMLHMPLLLGVDGKKLSKRRNPTSIFFYRDSGYLPEAFRNFLSLMGYSMPSDCEVYTIKELIDSFDPKRIGVSGAVFDIRKLNWLNQQYIINQIPAEELWERIKNWTFGDAFMAKLMPLVHQRMQNFGDFIALSDFLFINDLPYTEELFDVKGVSKEQATHVLQGVLWHMEDREAWTSGGIEEASRAAATFFELNHKKGVMPLLFGAIMGKPRGLPLFASIDLLGKERTRARLLAAIQFLGGISNKQLAELRKEWTQPMA